MTGPAPAAAAGDGHGLGPVDQLAGRLLARHGTERGRRATIAALIAAVGLAEPDAIEATDESVRRLWSLSKPDFDEFIAGPAFPGPAADNDD